MKTPKSIVRYDKTLPYIEDREPYLRPDRHLIKEAENSYKVAPGRRPSRMLLANKLRLEVNNWRDADYPGVTDITRELLSYWFENDHRIGDSDFHFWFCQREAIETLIYLFEVKKFNDLEPVIKRYTENLRRDLFKNAVEIVEDMEGKRKIIRYFPELEQEGQQDLPEKNLLRYAFKMATGSGKTMVMALVIVWSYFNRKRGKDSRFADNFLIVAPNVIVFERLAKDFANKEIFNKCPLIPRGWQWDLKVTLRGDSAPLNPGGNLVVDNIHQIYESKEEDKWTPQNVVETILGRKPQKDLAKRPISLLTQIKGLDNLIVLNDEAHHVHDESLQWHKTLTSIHHSLRDGLTLWLDFSATPKDQNGTYFPWIIVDYPLAQAVEDRIVKAPLIVHRVDTKDPEDINKDNVTQKYGDWIMAALERWKEHFRVYKDVGKKPVLFIMTEKNRYADRIAEEIRKLRRELNLKNSEKEVLVIHIETRGDRKGEVRKADLNKLREEVRNIDEPISKVKIIVSVLMLREGWDVQNVTVALGLRPFSSKARILPEQAVGRGLRLIQDVSPDHTQTLEVMGTQAFEEFVRKLEKEGVGINTVSTPPPLGVTIASEKSRLRYDIEIPGAELRYTRNYKNIFNLDPLKVPSLFDSQKLDEERKILLRMEFPVTETEVHRTAINPVFLETGGELFSYITNEVMKRANLTCDFSEIYPFVEKYISQKCFEVKVSIEDEKVRRNLRDIANREAIIDLLAKKLGKVTVEQKETVLVSSPSRLSRIPSFIWRRKHLRLNKTIFNFVAAFNNFEVDFTVFLDRCEDITRFAALAGKFKVDYLSSRGAVRFYWPDFVAVQETNGKVINWIIETKGREYEDTDRKDATIKKWCEDVSKQTKTPWHYLKVPQSIFDKEKHKIRKFSELVGVVKGSNHLQMFFNEG
ncbi:MAG: DEAD/DEAH box helicase family protein [Candidatus Aerophobetes bacterium]|nr:DEAD/DEAH box helicase family protein [Candidatus Aerophobetes bacterium]